MHRHKARVSAFVAASSIFALLLHSGLTRAQDAGANANSTAQPAAADQGAQLAEVTVTAERVAEDVQKTPVSMAVLTQDTFITAGVTNLSDITNAVPDVHITAGTNGGATASIRGVASSSGAVTLNYDGQYVGTFNGEAYDLARIEVLKGPQGTLYGLNATAGDINIITNAPVIGKFSTNGFVELGNYNEVDTVAVVNAPLGDQAAARVAATWNSHTGYRTLIGGGAPSTDGGANTTDYADFRSGRVSFLWNPTDQLRIRMTGEDTFTNYGPDAVQSVLVTAGPNLPANLPPYNFTSAGVNPHQWSEIGPGYHYGWLRVARADIEYNLGSWATLTLLPNYGYQDVRQFENYFGTPFVANEGLNYSYTYYEQYEARLNGQTPFGTRWQLGYFYLDQYNPNYAHYYESALQYQDLVALDVFQDPNNDQRQNAFYAQITQDVTSKLSVTGGIRNTLVHFQRIGYALTALNNTAFAASNGAVIQYTFTPNNPGPDNYEPLNWHGGLNYQLTPDDMLYFTSGTSFKAGGFTQINEYLPEEITAYEVGSKNQFLDHRLQLDASVFYYLYRNEQETAFLQQSTGSQAATTVNAGKSNLKGAEIDLTWLATMADRFQFNVDYTDASFLSFNVLQTEVSGTQLLVNLDGKKPPTAPPWVLFGEWQHTWRLNNQGEIVTTVDERWSDDYFLDIYDLPAGHVSPYNETNLDLTYRFPDQKWSVAGWVRNLEDKNVLDVANFVSTNGGKVYEFGWQAPRTYGVRVNWDY